MELESRRAVQCSAASQSEVGEVESTSSAEDSLAFRSFLNPFFRPRSLQHSTTRMKSTLIPLGALSAAVTLASAESIPTFTVRPCPPFPQPSTSPPLTHPSPPLAACYRQWSLCRAVHRRVGGTLESLQGYKGGAARRGPSRPLPFFSSLPYLPSFVFRGHVGAVGRVIRGAWMRSES